MLTLDRLLLLENSIHTSMNSSLSKYAVLLFHALSQVMLSDCESLSNHAEMSCLEQYCPDCYENTELHYSSFRHPVPLEVINYYFHS